jgi:cell division transport system permease protein
MTIRFLVAEGLSSLRRVAAASTIGAFLTGISLAIVGALTLVALAYRNELAAARTSATVEVFLADNVDHARAAEIASEITSFPNVRSTHLRTAQESAELFGTDLSDSTLLKGDLPLPTTIQVQLQERAQEVGAMAELGRHLHEIIGVDDVSFPSELVTTVQRRSRIFLRIALAIGGLLSIAVVGVVANTAQLTVISRRSVIGTMRLLGAERRWIVAPFVIQGLIIGLAGGAIATGLLYGAWALFNDIEPSLMPRDFSYYPLIFPLVGAALGMLGATAASSYYIARERTA